MQNKFLKYTYIPAEHILICGEELWKKRLIKVMSLEL